MIKDLRVLFMGTPDFAVSSCKALYENTTLVGVVTQPDRPKGRGGKMAAPEVKIYAESVGLSVYQPLSLKDGAFQSTLELLQPELIVVAAYGRILPEYILNFPRFGCINVHGSLLPKYRGAAPIQRAVMNGDKQTGVTIMKMAKGMDTGDMILQRSMDIFETDTSGSVFDRMAGLGAEALMEAIHQIVGGTAVYTPQCEEEATYAPMIEKSEGVLDFSKPAAYLRGVIMGMSPSPGAFVEIGNQRLKIYEALFGSDANAPAGSITKISKEGIEIACGDGKALLLKILQKQGKNRTDAYSYACGTKLSVGDFLK